LYYLDPSTLAVKKAGTVGVAPGKRGIQALN
jgi:hypothetical protein